jgi:hypothetical protein
VCLGPAPPARSGPVARPAGGPDGPTTVGAPARMPGVPTAFDWAGKKCPACAGRVENQECSLADLFGNVPSRERPPTVSSSPSLRRGPSSCTCTACSSCPRCLGARSARDAISVVFACRFRFGEHERAERLIDTAFFETQAEYLAFYDEKNERCIVSFIYPAVVFSLRIRLRGL